MNSFGQIFRVSIYGESHGKEIGVLIDGVPAGIPIDPEDFKADLLRRKTGATGTSPRLERDLPEIVSGLLNHHTTGAPVLIRFRNENVKRADYSSILNMDRPGHADFTARIKYGGYSDLSGGGRFSGRMTLALVAAGVLAKKIIDPIGIKARLSKAGGSDDIQKAIEQALKAGDSIGGLIECRAVNMPVGLGEPFFDSAESLISHLVFAIPAIKGIEFGAGFAAANMKGSEHNDCFLDEKGSTLTNHAGGINGGITNGNNLLFRVAVKPTSSIAVEQESFSHATGATEHLAVKGRHDACIALRVPVIVEAVTAIVLADLLFLNQHSKFIE